MAYTRLRRHLLFSPIARITAIAIGVASASCTVHRWRAVPISTLSLAQENIQSRRVRFTTDTGGVTMVVKQLNFPYATGVAEEGTGWVEFDVGTASRARVTERHVSGRLIARDIPISEASFIAQAIEGRRVRFDTASGSVVLVVRKVQFPLVEGEPAPSQGVVRVDLRRVTAVEVYEVNGTATTFRTIGLAAGIVGAVFLIVLLTKESCPFVYVDLGQGYELVGEAYAGAAFRSLQRDDLLPLPAVDEGILHVRLRNEARETQFTDRAELVLVDHGPDVRALSTFDGRPILVGTPIPPASARGLHGLDMTGLVSDRDETLWESDPVSVAAEDTPLVDELEAAFRSPASRGHVLEIVAGNTPWLDLVMGRFFAALGERIDQYVRTWNDPAAGSRLAAWREREGVDLTVEAFAGGTWRKVAIVPTVGAAALREIAVPLPPVSPSDGSVLRVRLRGGLGFWRVDRLALSDRIDRPVHVRRLSAKTAMATGEREDRDLVATVDHRYNMLSQMNEAVDLAFEVPPVAFAHARSAFLLTTGYYNVHPPVQNRWSPGTLRTIRDEPGGLSRLSRDLAREYVRLFRGSPLPGITQPPGQGGSR
jgi:hypothetical protein